MDRGTSFLRLSCLRKYPPAHTIPRLTTTSYLRSFHTAARQPIFLSMHAMSIDVSTPDTPTRQRLLRIELVPFAKIGYNE
jgi:hypothetical protein